MGYAQQINSDPIMKRVFTKLTDLGINWSYLPGAQEGGYAASQKWESEYTFKFTIKKGHYINVNMVADRLYELIGHAKMGSNAVYVLLVEAEKPTASNLGDWLYSEYVRQQKKHGKGKGFTDGYNTYDDGKGRGNAGEWKQHFKEDFSKRTDDAFNKGFHFTDAQRTEAFAQYVHEHGQFIDLNEFEDYMKKYFDRKDRDEQRQQKEQKEKKNAGDHFRDAFNRDHFGFGGHNFNERFWDQFASGNSNNRYSGPPPKQPPPPPPRSDSFQSILGLPNEKPAEDVLKKAYRTKCMEWHPDKNNHRVKEAEEMMKKINNAYSSLKSAYGYK
jgi:hypothetical protein